MMQEENYENTLNTPGSSSENESALNQEHPSGNAPDLQSDVQSLHPDVSLISEFANNVKNEIKKVVVGQEEMIDLLVAGILVGGHVLLEGYPGIAKTLTAKMLAQSIDAKFSRIQFTPDLMPTDITGTAVFNLKESEFNFRKGPIFSNIVLIDEINRAPAKTQAALMEVMEERQLTYDGVTYPLEFPFFVIATQNPVEQEGTYSLPEAQLDRFIFRIRVPYPTLEEERGRHFELTSAWAQGASKFSATAFASRYSNYIALIGRTGANSIFDEDEDGDADPTTGEVLPVFDFTPVPAEFQGLEIGYQTAYKLGSGQLRPAIQYDLIRGKRTDGGGNLPRISPQRVVASLAYSQQGWTVTPEIVWVDKSRAGEGDTQVDAYQLLNLRVGKAFSWGRTGGEVFANLQNLSNELAFSATTLNTVRGYTPLAGRSALVGLKLAF